MIETLNDLPVPLPVEETHCSLCGELWKPHVRVTRLYDDNYKYLGKREETVTTLDCIRVLKDRFRGPTGYAGPTGATGAAS